MNLILALMLAVPSADLQAKIVTKAELTAPAKDGAGYSWYAWPPGGLVPSNGNRCDLVVPKDGKLVVTCTVIDWENKKTETYGYVFNGKPDDPPEPGPDPEPGPEPGPDPEPGPVPDLDSSFGFTEAAFQFAAKAKLDASQALTVSEIFTDLGLEISRDGAIINTPMSVKESALRIQKEIRELPFAKDWAAWYTEFAKRYNESSNTPGEGNVRPGSILDAAAAYKEAGAGLDLYAQWANPNSRFKIREVK